MALDMIGKGAVQMSMLVRNLDVIVAVIGAQFLIALCAMVLESSEPCAKVPSCAYHRLNVALFFGLFGAFPSTRLVPMLKPHRRPSQTCSFAGAYVRRI
jgi:hypothetical protein